MQQGDIADRQWHLDKRLNVGHLTTTIALVIAAIGAWSAQNERISRLEERMLMQAATSVRVEQAVHDGMRDLKREISQLRDLLIQQMQRNGSSSSSSSSSSTYRP